MTRTLPTLAEAVAWLAAHWTEREIPIRLHARASEGWGPFYSPAFARHLSSGPHDVAQVSRTRTCSHPRKARDADAWTCPDCQGAGVYEATSLDYRYPMWHAMAVLARANRPAHDVVVTLVINEYDAPAVALVMGIGTGGVLSAIRALYARYEQAPTEGRRVGWISGKSDSQRSAEQAAPIAAGVTSG